MTLSFGTYIDKNAMLKDIFQEIREDFFNADYSEEDKLQVVMHRVIDNFVSYISQANLKTYLDWFNYSDMQTIDKGLLPERLDDIGKYDRCLLYCLIEQEMYNQDIGDKLSKKK